VFDGCSLSFNVLFSLRVDYSESFQSSRDNICPAGALKILVDLIKPNSFLRNPVVRSTLGNEFTLCRQSNERFNERFKESLEARPAAVLKQNNVSNITRPLFHALSPCTCRDKMTSRITTTSSQSVTIRVLAASTGVCYRISLHLSQLT
jgi:hypothetical protein